MLSHGNVTVVERLDQCRDHFLVSRFPKSSGRVLPHVRIGVVEQSDERIRLRVAATFLRAARCDGRPWRPHRDGRGTTQGMERSEGQNDESGDREHRRRVTELRRRPLGDGIENRRDGESLRYPPNRVEEALILNRRRRGGDPVSIDFTAEETKKQYPLSKI